MCGIVGFRSRDNFKFLREKLPEACETLAHRGPDDSGLFIDEHAGVGLAHRRLSIIDLSSAGHQPMKSDDGKVLISYNGEIYNFKEIGKLLERFGHTFNSTTDTEVVLKAYLQWGMECLEKFIGMFAFAIWDGRHQVLVLARDRLGIKPLYYHFSENHHTLLFASELKALMTFGGITKTIDLDSIPLFLHYQYIPAPGTIFKNTYKLLPGHFLMYDGENAKTKEYWRIPDPSITESGSGNDEEEYLQRLDDLLTNAVSDRLISDVPLGALLSGGIDSSMVVALMQKVSSTPSRTFSIGFKEQGYNEAPWAARVAAHLNTDHTELYVSAKDALDVIFRLADVYDEPFADSSAIPTYLVSHLTRQKVTVALSGDGGDEQFCGYVRYWTTKSMAAGFHRFPLPLKKALAKILGFIPSSWVENCYLPLHNFLPQRLRMANFPDKWQKLLKLMEQTRISELYRMTICLWSESEVSSITGRALQNSKFDEIFRETADWPLLSRLMTVDQKTYLPDGMLTKVDRASMATSLEIRVPLLDHRVVEFTANLPEHFKYRNGTGKYLLKKLLARYLPVKLFERPKMGFGVPIDHWLRFELKDLLLDYLSAERLNKEGLFNSKFVEKKIKEHLCGQVNHQYRLWPLLMWEMWRERWLGL
ncbi:MAG: asparagine synthase (glutamine-hydrolyzing) [Desulfobacterales bacterium]|jgi:asparagine synthase (glutamine-hydrolysing)